MLTLRNVVWSDRWGEPWRASGQAGGARVRRKGPGQAALRKQAAGARPQPVPTLVPVLSRAQRCPVDQASALVRAELANEHANSVWRKPWNGKRQPAVADARAAARS